MTKFPESPFPVEVNFSDIAVFAIIVVNIFRVQKLFIIIIPVNERFVACRNDLCKSYKVQNSPPTFSDHTLDLLDEREMLHVFISSIVCGEYRLVILQASQSERSPGISSLSNSGRAFKALLNHGFHALLVIAESVMPLT
jgi:hypothetical protein